jgi:hypothetical protein
MVAPRAEGVATEAHPIPVADLPAPSLPETTTEPDVLALAAWLWAIMLGTAALVTATIARAAGRALDEVGGASRRVPLIPGATAGLLVGAGRVIVQLGSKAAGVMDPSGRRTTSAKEGAVALIDDVVPRIVARVVDRLDLTQLITDHIDLDEVLRSIDVDELAQRFPVEDLARRLDVRELAGRVDVEYLLQRVDLGGLALRVIEEIDLPAIIRGSTEDLSGEALDALRFRAMHADQLLTRWRDRLAPGRGNGSPRSGTGT